MNTSVQKVRPPKRHQVVERMTSGLFVAGMGTAFGLCLLAFGILKGVGTDAAITFFAHAFHLPTALKDARDAEAAALRDLFLARNENIRLEREHRALVRQMDEAASRPAGASVGDLERKLRAAEFDALARRDEVADLRRRSDEFAVRAAAAEAEAQRLTGLLHPSPALSALSGQPTPTQSAQSTAPPQPSRKLSLRASVADIRRGVATISAGMRNTGGPETAFRIVAPRPVLLVGGIPVSSELFQLFCPQEDCISSLRAAIRLGGDDAQRVSLRFFSDLIEPEDAKKLELEMHVQTLDGARLTLRFDISLR